MHISNFIFMNGFKAIVASLPDWLGDKEEIIIIALNDTRGNMVLKLEHNILRSLFWFNKGWDVLE